VRSVFTLFGASEAWGRPFSGSLPSEGPSGEGAPWETVCGLLWHLYLVILGICSPPLGPTFNPRTFSPTLADKFGPPFRGKGTKRGGNLYSCVLCKHMIDEVTHAVHGAPVELRPIVCVRD